MDGGSCRVNGALLACALYSFSLLSRPIKFKHNTQVHYQIFVCQALGFSPPLAFPQGKCEGSKATEKLSQGRLLKLAL